MKFFSIGIVGYRNFHDYELFKEKVKDITPSRIVSGGCKGTDTLAKRYAQEHNIPLIEHLPKGHQRYDFLNRNSLIVDDSSILIAFVHKDSKGTYDTINKAKKRQGMKIYEIEI